MNRMSIGIIHRNIEELASSTVIRDEVMDDL